MNQHLISWILDNPLRLNQPILHESRKTVALTDGVERRITTRPEGKPKRMGYLSYKNLTRSTTDSTDKESQIKADTTKK